MEGLLKFYDLFFNKFDESEIHTRIYDISKYIGNDVIGRELKKILFMMVGKLNLSKKF